MKVHKLLPDDNLLRMKVPEADCWPLTSGGEDDN